MPPGSEVQFLLPLDQRETIPAEQEGGEIALMTLSDLPFSVGLGSKAHCGCVSTPAPTPKSSQALRGALERLFRVERAKINYGAVYYKHPLE